MSIAALPMILAAAAAYAQPQATSRPVPVPPPLPPSSPRPPPPPPPPEVVQAFAAARQTEQLARAGRWEEAMANYRDSLASPLGPAPDHIRQMRAMHAGVLANILIWAGRAGEADGLLADHLERSRGFSPVARGFDDKIIDMRLYIAAGSSRVADVLALIEQRVALTSRAAGSYCPDGSLFPEVVVPLHHVAEVADRLRALGCDDTILSQLDRIAARRIGEGSALTLPPRAPAPSAASAE